MWITDFSIFPIGWRLPEQEVCRAAEPQQIQSVLRPWWETLGVWLWPSTLHGWQEGHEDRSVGFPLGIGGGLKSSCFRGALRKSCLQNVYGCLLVGSRFGSLSNKVFQLQYLNSIRRCRIEEKLLSSSSLLYKPFGIVLLLYKDEIVSSWDYFHSQRP